MLQDKDIAIYCSMDNLLKEMNHSEHNNKTFTDGQAIATAVVSALYFRGNHTIALDYVRSHIFIRVIKKDGFTQEELANEIGIKISQISRIERGVINTSIANKDYLKNFPFHQIFFGTYSF